MTVEEDDMPDDRRRELRSVQVRVRRGGTRLPDRPQVLHRELPQSVARGGERACRAGRVLVRHRGAGIERSSGPVPLPSRYRLIAWASIQSISPLSAVAAATASSGWMAGGSAPSKMREAS
jgi:hypothetical protein